MIYDLVYPSIIRRKRGKIYHLKGNFFYFLLQKRLKCAVSNKRDDDIARAITTPYSGCAHLHFTNFHTSKITCSLGAVGLLPSRRSAALCCGKRRTSVMALCYTNRNRKKKTSCTIDVPSRPYPPVHKADNTSDCHL